MQSNMLRMPGFRLFPPALDLEAHSDSGFIMERGARAGNILKSTDLSVPDNAPVTLLFAAFESFSLI